MDRNFAHLVFFFSNDVLDLLQSSKLGARSEAVSFLFLGSSVEAQILYYSKKMVF